MNQGGDFGSAKSGKPGNFRIGLEFGRRSKGNLVGEFGQIGEDRAFRGVGQIGQFGVSAAGDFGEISAGSADQ